MFLGRKLNRQSSLFVRFFANRGAGTYKCVDGWKQRLTVSFDFRPTNAVYSRDNHLRLFVSEYKRNARNKVEPVSPYKIEPFGATSQGIVANAWNSYSQVFDVTCGVYFVVRTTFLICFPLFIY